MKEMIIQIAKELGIEVIGFTSVINYDYLKEFLVSRKANGFSNELEEQDIYKRLYVKNIFSDCKSIIAIGVPYAIGYKNQYTTNSGKISVVSFGEDYHVKVSAILDNIARKIKENINFQYKICVDTSFLIDREICKNAGIGSYGKNSLIINEKYGSFIYLGYMLTNLEIKTDNDDKNKKNKDICGSCSICVNNCPNNAIFQHGGINTKRCVSYLTQTKTYIPLEYRRNMSNQIYGCDICQLICPKNKKNLQLEAKDDYRELFVDLNELMNMSNNDFNHKYGRLSGAWRGKNVWKRNGIISIANLDIKSMYDLLTEELKNPSEMIRIYSAWSLMKLNRQKSQDILNSILKYENDIVKREYIKLLEEDVLC